MKQLLDTKGDEAKYFKGKVIDKHKTPMGHFFIKCTEVKELKMANGQSISTYIGNDMNFLCPKRRVKTFSVIEQKITLGNTYIFKLLQESRSKKWTISEIFDGE